MELKFTKVQQKMLAVLADGEPHPRRELWACIPDVEGFTDEKQLNEFARKRANNHLSDIREKLLMVGHDIICQVIKNRLCFRHVRLLNGDSHRNAVKTAISEAEKIARGI